MIQNEIESTHKNKMYIILTQIVDKLNDKDKNIIIKKSLKYGTHGIVS